MSRGVVESMQSEYLLLVLARYPGLYSYDKQSRVVVRVKSFADIFPKLKVKCIPVIMSRHIAVCEWHCTLIVVQARNDDDDYDDDIFNAT